MRYSGARRPLTKNEGAFGEEERHPDLESGNAVRDLVEGSVREPIASKVPNVNVDRNLGKSIAAAFLATGVVYLTLPGIGFLLFGETSAAASSLGGALVCGALAYGLVRNVGWDKIVR